MVLIPPALVAIVPPTVADSREARFTPYARPAAAACARRSAIVAPAPAVTCAASGSTGPSSRSRLADSTTAPRPSRGAAAGRHRPAHQAGVAALRDHGGAVPGAGPQHRRDLGSRDPGRTAHSASPAYRRVQSVV